MIAARDFVVDRGRFRLGPLDLAIERGEHVLIVGPSGAGKSSLLEAVAGLHPLSSGTLDLAGRDATRLDPADRRVGFVPQEGRLFRGSVAENLTFGLRVRGMGRRERRQEATAWAERLGLTVPLDRPARSLSGGEKRRVTLGRALAWSPDLLLLDEPLAGLDQAAAAGIRDLLIDLKTETGVTTLHASHDPTDQQHRLADRVVRIEEGRIVS